jgi:hypothetical protein
VTRLRAAADWFFYALYRLDLFTSKELLEWKALLGVTVLQVIALVSAGIWLEMSFGVAVMGGVGKVGIWFGVLVLVPANYWFFMRGGEPRTSSIGAHDGQRASDDSGWPWPTLWRSSSS